MSAVKAFSEILAAFADEKATVTQVIQSFFTENAASDETISADQLTVLVSEITDHDYSAKTVRQVMRSMALRDQSQYRNATWRVSLSDAEKVTRKIARIAS